MLVLVQRKLAGLSERLIAVFIGASVRLLTCVNVHMFFEVLRKKELFPTYLAAKIPVGLVGSSVSLE